MAVWCLGSINADYFYAVPHIPAPGETLAATGLTTGLGGKGANQSVAAAKAGSVTRHIGAVGPGSEWIIERLDGFGVDTQRIRRAEAPTGHAMISVAEDGENAIVILAGANGALTRDMIEEAIALADAGDILLIQNETNLQVEAARAASAEGLRVLYSAAPFDADAVEAVLPFIDTLILNEIEAEQLENAVNQRLSDLPAPHILVTLGAKGACHLSTASGEVVSVDGVPVTPVDTTGAGDTFAGYFAAGRDQGMGVREAMELAARAAALKVTRRGTADAIPSRAEVDAFAP
ncbi:MAG: ribokinase [Paracoccaceae bacterium]|nr:ribokinase [Paracoccaceae bacterium]